ncbi:hypothetical protein AAC387_Pa06g1141 [Persea americana]
MGTPVGDTVARIYGCISQPLRLEFDIRGLEPEHASDRVAHRCRTVLYCENARGGCWGVCGDGEGELL